MKYVFNERLHLQQYTPHERYKRAYGNREHREPTIEALFHENTKLSETAAAVWQDSLKQFSTEPHSITAAMLDPDYRFAETIDLPPAEPIEESFETLRTARTSDLAAADRPLSVSRLSTLLGTALATVRRVPIPPEDHEAGTELTSRHRPYPSAGKLFPIEHYLLVRSIDDLDPGAYYYAPDDHALRVIQRFENGTEEYDELHIDGTIGQDGDATLVMTNAISRVRAKYGPRGYRFALLEAGHAGQNVQLAATALGIGASPTGGYLDTELEPALGIDGFNEGVVNAIVLNGADDERAEGGAEVSADA